MLVKFLRPIRYAKDGIHMETALEGQRIDLPLELAKSLIRDMYADEVKEEKKEEVKKDALSAESGKSELAGTEADKVDNKNKSK